MPAGAGGTGRRLGQIDKARDSKINLPWSLGHKEFGVPYSECAGKPWKLENTRRENGIML